VTGAGKKDRKALLREYREAPETGGVYAIANTVTGKRLVLSTTTLSKARNSLDFAKATGSCVNPTVAGDWALHGPESFDCEILETLERKAEQGAAEFAEDVKALAELWRERIPPESRY